MTRTTRDGVAGIVLSLAVLSPLLEAQASTRAQELADLRARAEAGEAVAQTMLGRRYANGEGVRQDDAEAIVWLRRAAGQGFDPAQFSLGEMYQWGRGVTKNDAEAAAWYRKAAEQDHVDAQVNLGNMYFFAVKPLLFRGARRA